MSTSVNALINDSYQKCSLCGNGQSVSGTEAMAGLRDLMSVIAELSGQNLALSDVETADITSNGSIRIMGELPDGWEEVTSLPQATSDLVGQVRKCGDTIYGCHAINTVTFAWIERPDIIWPDLIIDPLPDRVTALTRKLGERYAPIYPAEKHVLDTSTKRSLPSFYTCETQLEKHTVANIEYNYEVFIIETDSIQTVNYRITYLKAIPQYKLTDKLYFSEKVLSVIEDGLCAKLCLRYKLMDIKPFFDAEYANGLRLLKRTNQANRPMTYNFVEGGSYLDSFYNGYSPRSW